MLEFNKSYSDSKIILDELLIGSGVVLFKDVFLQDQINEAREIVNKYADNHDEKETHFNAEAEDAGKIHLQQRVWNLFDKGKVFSTLITHDIIFDLMTKFLGTEFICGSYCASRLLPGAVGQEPHIDYPYWDFYNEKTFPMGLNSSFPQNCQVTIPLDLCSESSGATAYYPGSQRNLRYPTKDDDFSNLKQMTARPGDLVFFNGNCWHGAMSNKSDHQRAAILIEFLPKYVKPVEDMTSLLKDDFKKNCTKRVKQLLGFNYPYPKIMDVSQSVNDIGIGYKTKNS